MKLFYSPTSPFARKVRLALIELDMVENLEEISVLPMENPPELHRANPLGKVPTLEIAGGQGIFDSTVICQYLDGISGENKLVPSNSEKWIVLTKSALANGLCDSAFSLVMEKLRPAGEQSHQWKTRWRDSITRSLDAIGREVETLETELNLYHLSVAAALTYLEFRLPELIEIEQHRDLWRWLKKFKMRPSMVATAFPS